MKNNPQILKKILLTVFLTCFLKLEAQSPVYLNFNVENGLPSNTVYYVLQDSKGFIWFATEKGVVRYDGIHFTIFTTSDGLADNECFDIFEDSKHRIWFASYNGEPSFYQNGKFYNKENCTLLDIESNAFHGPGLKTMEDGHGTVFYLTNFGIYSMSPGRKLIRHKNDASFFSALVKNESGDVLAIGSNPKAKSVIINLSKSNQTSYINPEKGIQISSKGFSEGEDIYFNMGPILYQFKKNKMIEKINGTADQVIQFITTSKNEFWLGTNGGIQIYDKQFRFPPKTILKGNSVSCIFTDREKNYWISTINKGVYLLINPDIYSYNSSNGLGFDQCYSITPLKNDKLAIGSDAYKFALLGKNEIRNFEVPKHYGIGLIKRVVLDHKNYYVSSGSSFLLTNERGEILKENTISAKDFYVSPDNLIYTVGGNCLTRYTKENIFKKNPGDKSFNEQINLVPVKANGIFVDHNQILYTYGLFGAKYYTERSLKDIIPNKPFPTNIVDMMETEDEILWFASTVKGLVAVHKGEVYTFGVNEGLPTSYTTSICKGTNNQLWLGTSNGLCKITYRLSGRKIRISVQVYTQADGIINNTINDVLYIHDTLWLASPKGLCFFNEKILYSSKIPPVFNLEHLYAGNEDIPIGHEIILDPGQNQIKLSFTGLSFASLGKIKYKYRLKGQNENWSYTSNQEIEYPSLLYGDYCLEIQVIDAFGQSSKIQHINFRILPYFYQTWWFMTVIGLLIASSLFYIISNRIRKIKLNHRLKEQIFELEHQKLKAEHKETILLKEYFELEQKALLLQMNPHFIFNSINSIQGLYKNNREKADDYLIRFSNLLRQILEFSKKKAIGLDQEILFLKNYLEINKLRFSNDYNYEIRLESGLYPENIGIAPMIVQPFIENALIHGIQSLKAKGEIDISFRMKNEQLICEITDNGIGRERSKEINKNRIHKSVGMEITEKRLNFFNKNEQKKSMEIIDLKDEQEKAAGTKVILSINVEEFY